MESLDENIVKSLTLNHLMPGTILHGEPCSKTRTGVIVSLGNGVKGYVSRNHLPPRLRDDMSRIKKGFRIVVMACQQNSHLLILNAHPDVLALSKPEKRSSFESIGIGDIIACTVKSITKKGAVNFIPERNGGNERGSLITARAESSMLSGKLEDYDVNSTHECRVIDFRMVERELIVATNKSLLTCKLLTMHDATAGDLVTAYVKAIKPKGIEVKVANKWHGFIPLIHVSDKPFTSLEKRFSIKQPLECRILNVDIERGSFLLTAKPSLVKNSGNIINSYSSENVGTIATGMVVSIKEGGGLVFEFFGGVRGFMMAREAVRLGEISIGISVQVRIVNVEPEESRMLVAVADMTLTNDSVIYRAKPVSNIEDSALTYFAKVVGSSKIGIGEKMREKVDVIVKIGKKKEKTWVASELMSDNLDPPFSTLSDCIRENAKLSRVAVLGQAGGMLKVTCKRFLIGWLETHPRIVRFEDLEEGSLVCGTVSQRHGNQGYFVELAGGSALVGLAPISNIGNGKIAESELQIGQTVVGRVSKLNKEKCQFSLDLRSEVCTPKENEFDWWKFGSDLVESALDEINWFRENNSRELDMPKIGDWMEMTVAQAMHDIVMVESIENKNLKGFIRLASLVDRGFKKGQKVYAVVIDISFPSCELQLYLPERVSSQGADKKKRSEEFRNELLLKDLEYDAHIVLVKRDYVVAVTCSTDSSLPSIAILPSRYHPNDYLRTTNDVRFKCGEFVKVRVVATAEQVLICRATSDIASHLEGNLKRKKTKLQSLSSVKRLKPFVVYTAKVIGEWRHCGENACSVELDAGDGSLGRLHASELSSEYLVEGQQPVKEFLRKNTGKQVNIKVIGIGKIKEKVMMKGGRLGNKQHEVTLVRRVAECTLRPEKISNVRRKQSILGYKQSYDISSVVPVFVRSTGHAGVVRVEASPIFHGVIRKQNLDDRKLKVNPTDEQSALIDLDFEPGEMILARVIGISKARKDRCLELSVVETTKIFEPGHCVTGRVISTTRSPSAIILELSNGQRALLPPTGITGYYKEALSLVEKCLVNEIYQLKLLRFDKNSGRWIAATETRYDGTDCKERSDEAYSPLIVDDSPLKEGTVLNAFISSVSNGTFFAELGPGVVGRISKQK
ncbi:hypothetical protein AB6A40_005430 [Gnathostoma spinigerum]|uniref:S1 motif domain-containing protein n=1 Tax=Gnathostoma spinigerum TaxID=75299 RepID=A0ABD6EHM5_9BILA